VVAIPNKVYLETLAEATAAPCMHVAFLQFSFLLIGVAFYLDRAREILGD
jgi:hypothetical protein